MINQQATKYATMIFKKFATLNQLPEPRPDYIIAIQGQLALSNWTIGDLKNTLGWLLTDPEYQEKTRYNKFPTFADLIRAKNAIGGQVIQYCVEHGIKDVGQATQMITNQLKQKLIELKSNKEIIENLEIPY